MTVPQERLPGLDLLRAVAILWVMLFHSFLVGGLGENWLWLSRFGWMGVDLFFVLSGFLIGTQVLTPLASGEALRLGDFYARRALRILPAYFATIALYALFPMLREAQGMEPVWKFVFFVSNLSIDYAANAALSHAWSLCVEEHFYWFFPLLAIWLMRRPAQWKFVGLCTFIVLGGIALRSAIWLHGMDTDPNLTRNWFIEDLYYPSWNRLDGLLCGVALAAWKVMRPASWHAARGFAAASAALGLLVMAIAITLFQNRIGLLANSVGWPVLSLGLGLLVFAAAGKDNPLGRARIPLAGWLAAISFSLYLAHKAAYHVVQQVWGQQLSGTGMLAFAVYGATALAAGAVLHYAVERPGLQLRRRLRVER